MEMIAGLAFKLSMIFSARFMIQLNFGRIFENVFRIRMEEKEIRRVNLKICISFELVRKYFVVK